MFERYTEKARRVIFFARYEASQYGSPYIETEHLLLGLMREDKAMANRFLRQQGSIESIRKEIEARITIRERISTSVEVPLSQESKRILNFATEEAERLGHKHVGTEHLLLGILREEKCFGAEILQERGLRLTALREELARERRLPVGLHLNLSETFDGADVPDEVRRRQSFLARRFTDMRLRRWIYDPTSRARVDRSNSSS